MGAAKSEPFVVPVGPGGNDSEDIVDQQPDINGVGQIMVMQGGAATCTGTLINPRTVIFAAHCVNFSSPTNWGYTDRSGQPIGVGFRADNKVGYESWSSAPDGRPFATNVAESFYNISQVWWHPHSTTLGTGLEFIEADVALAAIDTPARDIPIWSLLFSPLPAPESISDTTGTGYHVTVTGYGLSGDGPSGMTGDIDYRRRTAENMLGMLGSLVDWQSFIQGSSEGNYLQNLYQIDFDDATRSDRNDVNVMNDDALPNEGVTAPGDSGGPLILDQTFDEKVVIGVLSGGSTANEDQKRGGFGTMAFYQPLYLYWDWIAANNPYRYVSAVAGDGKWSDPAHWVTLLDPAYRVLDANGKLQAGIPTTLGTGPVPTTDFKFGQVCKRDGSDKLCLDLANRTLYRNGIAEGQVAPGISTAEAIGLPGATIDNGLPGATGFVPINQAKDFIFDEETLTLTDIPSRFFDVTLGAAGKTDVDMDVTIDRLTLAHAGAALDVQAGRTLTSFQDITQIAGMVRVDGTLATPWDYFVMSGVVTGSGTIKTPYFTNMAGILAPGNAGSVGTLRFNGNVILASGSTLLMDIGPGGTSDRIVVSSLTRTIPPLYSWQEPIVETLAAGDVSLGGTLQLAPVAGYLPRAGDSFTLLTTQGALSGSLTVAPLSAILTPELSRNAGNLRATLVAGDYADAVDTASPTQRAYAAILDANRAAYDRYAGLYGILDMAQTGDLRATLDGLVPAAPAAGGMMGVAALDMLSGFFRNRTATLRETGGEGSLAMYGRPIQLAARAATGIGLHGDAVQSDGAAPLVREGAMAEDMSAYLAGGYIEGNAAVMPAPGVGRADFDGFYLSGGVERRFGDRGYLGFALSYAELDGHGFAASQSGRGKLALGTLHGAIDAGGLRFDGQVGAGAYDSRSTRGATVGNSVSTLTSRDRAFAINAEGGVSAPLDLGTVAFAPRGAIRYAHIGFTPAVETGGLPALSYDLGAFDSLEGRLGASARVEAGPVRPYLTANYVHAFDTRPDSFGADLAGGAAIAGLFPLAGSDRNWGEVGAGLSIDAGSVTASVRAETTVGRSDIESRNYQAEIRIRF